MRRQTEIALVEKHPHLFHPSILKAYGFPFKMADDPLTEHFGFREGFKEGNFFECGEGWVPIITAFAEQIQEIQDEYQNSKEEEVVEEKVVEEKVVEEEANEGLENESIVINGAMIHKYRLWMIIDTPSDMKEILITKIKVMKDFASAISGYFCEICGQSIKVNHLNKKVKCAVCQCRDD